METPNTTRSPVTFVVFGATGDLFGRKIVPSLYLLYSAGKLPPQFSIIGFGRQALTTTLFRDHVFVHVKNAAPHVTKRGVANFLKLFTYHQGEFTDDASFTGLKHALTKRDHALGHTTLKSFYLAVPPNLVRVLVPHLGAIAAKGERRNLLIEKPYGTDEASARELTAFLHQFFDEKEIFRIDHYLAKPALDTLLHARTRHTRYNQLLAEESIQNITISLYETLGVEKRGAFYDGIGALKDVGQNHLLEMLALALMPIPHLNPEDICHARGQFLKKLPRLSKEEVEKQTVRAQYEGYQTILGVRENSPTETYFRVAFELSRAPYKGVPVILESGKRMRTLKKDIVVSFNCDHTDSLHIELEPIPRIYFKKGALIETLEEFNDPMPSIQYANEYATLFSAAWENDVSFFPTGEEVEYLWRFIDPIRTVWEAGTPPLLPYPQNAVLPWNS